MGRKRKFSGKLLDSSTTTTSSEDNPTPEMIRLRNRKLNSSSSSVASADSKSGKVTKAKKTENKTKSIFSPSRKAKSKPAAYYEDLVSKDADFYKTMKDMTKKNKAKDAQYQNLRAGSVNAKRPKSSGDAAPSTSVSSLPRIPKKPKPLPQKVSLELENPILDGRDDDDDFLETFLPETHKYWVDKGRELPVAIETLIFPIYWFSNDPLLPCPLGGPSLHPPGTPPRPEYDDLIPCTPECPKTPERSFCFDETGVLNASFAASITFSPNVSHSSLTSSPSRSTAGDDTV